MKTLFLGGTCGDSNWRDKLVPMLNENIDWFNPVVADWTPECMAKEILARETSDYVLYTITPKMEGVYSIAEVVDDSNKRPDKTILCILENDGGTFSPHQKKSLARVGYMVTENGAKFFTSLEDVANYLNNI